MPFDLKAYFNRIIVRPDPSEEKSKGGILLPEIARRLTYRGTVLSVGAYRSRDGAEFPSDLSPGDVVRYSKYAGADLECSGEKLAVLTPEDVLAVEPPEKKGK